MLRRQHCWLLFAAALFTTAPHSACWAGPYSEIIVFGDGLSDVGNAVTRWPRPPNNNGQRVYFGNRNSNGPLWIERLAERLDVPAPIASANGGLNFAWAGATTGSLASGSDDMDQQVSQYLRRNAPNGDQLFVLWGGANDFWGGQQDTDAPVLELRNRIVELAEAGATSFLVANMGSRFGEFSLPQAEEFNLLLSLELSTLRSVLPDTTIFDFDYFSFFQAIEDDPAAFGFTNINGKACLDCGFGINEGSIVVPNPDEYYFFDRANPSATAHRQIGDAAYAVVVPEPSGLLTVLLPTIGLIVLRRSTLSKKRRSKQQRNIAIPLLGASMAGVLLVHNAPAADFYLLDDFSGNGFVLSDSRRLGVAAVGPSAYGPGIEDTTAGRLGVVRWQANRGAEDVGPPVGINYALAASDDLTVLFGVGNGGHLFRWSEESGTADLGSLHDGADDPIITPFDSTPDGRIIVGVDSARNLHNVPPDIAFRWTVDTGLEQIAVGQAIAVSDDGNVVVGKEWGEGAFRWTPSTGLESLAPYGKATDVSADGSVVVGWDYRGRERGAFRWSTDDALQLLDMPLGRDESYAHAVSADGSVVLGTMANATPNYPGNEVFRWTAESGVEVLTPAEDVVFDGVTTPLMSRNGDVVVANGWSYSAEASDAAFIWREGHGTQFLREVLANEFQLAGQLENLEQLGVSAISADGRAFLGLASTRGVDDQILVWVAVIPEPSTLALLAVGGLALMSHLRPVRPHFPHLAP
jgi:phospholipase/lecithinase/hemolysin/uncharacterized membrane protein